MKNFELIAAAYTPFAESGELLTEVVSQQAEELVGRGVDGVFIAGTTGESLSLTVDERMALAEAWQKAAASHRLKLMVHVGAAAIADAARLAAHAGGLGVDAISAMAPCYFKPQQLEDLAASLARIAEEAPKVPFYFYDIPSWTGVAFRSSDLLEQHAADIPNFAGIKYTSSDIVDFERCVAVADDRYDLFWGCDEALLVGLTLGATGAIGSTFNFLAPKAREVIAAHAAGDLKQARESQLSVVRIVDILARYGFHRASKCLVSKLGADCGPVRLPLLPLTSAEWDELSDSLASLGIKGQWMDVLA